MTQILARTEVHNGRRYRWHVALEKKMADAWVGVFWEVIRGRAWVLDVWVCIVPFFPIHMFIQKQPPLCVARSRSGDRCERAPMFGSTVCRIHGGY